uniref:Uncharacterized protein n=1 Tax=Lepeophtheirus salmonis TaxID=72036 RepID=A0A0K2TTN3_LEPSM
MKSLHGTRLMSSRSTQLRKIYHNLTTSLCQIGSSTRLDFYQRFYRHG